MRARLPLTRAHALAAAAALLALAWTVWSIWSAARVELPLP